MNDIRLSDGRHRQRWLYGRKLRLLLPGFRAQVRETPPQEEVWQSLEEALV